MFSLKGSNLNHLVCRISVEKKNFKTEVGTGTLVTVNKNTIYILTCKHLVFDARQITIEQKNNGNLIKIEVSLEEILYSSNNKDAAIIVLDTQKYNGVNICERIIAVSNIKQNELELLGFPNVKNINSFKEVYIDQGRMDGDYFKTDNRLDSNYSTGKENCEGFSGGAIYEKYSEFAYLYAIASEYSDELDYFTVIKINEYNKLLQEKGYDKINICENDVMLCNDLFKQSQKRINNTRSTIGKDFELNRTELIQKILLEDEKIQIVSGDPGIGKSVILKKLALENEYNYYFISDDFDKDMSEFVQAIIEAAKICENIFVLIDAAEKIFEKEYENNFIEFIKLLKDDNIKFVISIRSYSLNNLTRLVKVNTDYSIENIVISCLTEDDVKLISDKYPNLSSMKKETLELLKNPFYMDVIISREINNELNSIENEYQIKNLIWEEITERDEDIKAVLRELLKAKLDLKNQFVNINIPNEKSQILIKKHIIEKFNSHYKFTHDKYEDIVAMKYFDFKSVDNTIGEIVRDIENPLSWGRAFKLWIQDRLTDNQIDVISDEIDSLHSNEISYIWKWNGLEAIYQSKFIKNYLSIKKQEVENSEDFIIGVYDVIISTDLIDVKIKNPNKITMYQYFNSFVCPSFRIFSIIDFFNGNRNLINENNYYYVTQLLIKSTKTAKIFWDLFSDKTNFSWLLDFTLYLFDKHKSIYIRQKKESFKYICEAFVLYSSLNINVANEYLQKIIDEINDEFSNEFSKNIFFEERIDGNSISANSCFLKNFQEKLFTLFNQYTQYKDNRIFRSLEYSEERLYEINDELRSLKDYPQNNIVFNMLEVNFDETFNFVVNYINEKIEKMWMKLNKTENENYKEKFVFKSKSRDIIYIKNHYAACLNDYSNPKLINCLAKSLLYKMVKLSEKQSVEEYLNVIFEKSNNLVLISVAVNFILINMTKYYSVFVDFAENYYLFNLDNEFFKCNFNLFNINLTCDFLTNEFKSEYNNIFKTKNDFGEAVLISQKYSEVRDKIVSILNNWNKNENLEIQRFAHDFDLSNFVAKEQIGNKVVFEPKEIEDKTLLEYKKENEKISKVTSEFLSFRKLLENTENQISELEVKRLIKNYKDGKYDSHNCYYNIEEYLQMFYLRNPKFISNKKRLKKYLKDFNRRLTCDDENISDIMYIEITLKTLCSLDKKIIIKYEKNIVSFLFKIIINNTWSNKNYQNVIEKICKNNSKIKSKLLEILIAYTYFDQKNLEINNRMNVGRENILIEEMDDAQKTFERNMILCLKKGKVYKQTDEFNIEHFNVIEYIISLVDDNNCVSIEIYLINLLENILNDEHKKENREFYIKLPMFISKFLIDNIINRSHKNLSKLKNYICENYENCFDIVAEFLSSICAHVQDTNISGDDGFAEYRVMFNILENCEYKKDLCVAYSNGFIMNINHLNIGKILSKMLYLGVEWRGQLKVESIKLLQGHEDEYVKFIMKFMDSSIGVKAFAWLNYFYPTQISKKYIFENKEIILESFKNINAFNELECINYYELFFQNIYNEYDFLTEKEKNVFYEILTSLGCNGPSAFSLYLRHQIEY